MRTSRLPGFYKLSMEERLAKLTETYDLGVEEGAGEAVLDGVRTAIKAGFAVVVPAGAKHNIINTGSVPLVVHHTRADAEADNEHFDGKTTE